MARNSSGVIIFVLILAVAVYFLFINQGVQVGEQSTSGDLIRTVPNEGGGKFTVTYSSNQEGSWVAVVVDIVSSNCKFSNGKNEYKTVIIGDGFTSQPMEVTGTNCVFSGDYDFYSSSKEEKLVKFGSQTVK